MIYYSSSHNWIRVEGSIATVGFTNQALEEFGKIVYIQMPEKGRDVSIGDEVCVLESTKSAIDIYTPLSGTVVDVNRALVENPNLLQEEMWIYSIRIHSPQELNALMTKDAYEALFV